MPKPSLHSQPVVAPIMGDDATTGGDAPGTGGMGTPPADDQDDETSSKVLCPGTPLQRRQRVSAFSFIS